MRSLRHLLWMVTVALLLGRAGGAQPIPDFSTLCPQCPGCLGADLTLTVDDARPSNSRGTINSYTLTYASHGADVATGVVITATVPANTTFDLTDSSSAWRQVGSGNTYTLSLPDLDLTKNTPSIRDADDSQEAQPQPQPTPEAQGHLPSWRVAGETVTVVGQAPLREEELIGPYQQPRWTARRRFGETRVFVIPEGDVEFEYWLVPELQRHGEETGIEQQFELEMGLPRRFQVDLYAVTHKEGNTGSLALDQTKLEVRWALANWGRLWGNPALYLEWIAIDSAPDHLEGKLLLGDQISPRLHWGANLVFEHEMGGQRTNTRELTAGLSYTVRDEKFSVGPELKLAWEDTKSNRGDYVREELLGPSFQFRPLPQAHMDIVLLAGLNRDAPRAKGIFILGWEF